MTKELKRTIDYLGDKYIEHDTGAVQVFPQGDGASAYFRLDSYKVGSALSGPSLMLIPLRDN